MAETEAGTEGNGLAGASLLIRCLGLVSGRFAVGAGSGSFGTLEDATATLEATSEPLEIVIRGFLWISTGCGEFRARFFELVTVLIVGRS